MEVKMSVDMYQRELNKLDGEIADLEKKKAIKDSEIAGLNSKINSIKRSITKYTTPSLLNTKTSQIQQYERQNIQKSKESAEIGKKIADKKKKRNEVYLKLQKEQTFQENKNKLIQKEYEQKIKEMQKIINSTIQNNITNYQDDCEQYDVFISHASEDKEDFVDEFVNELRNVGFKVWYDTSELRWGDSMRTKIDDGLKKSKYGIIVLSPDYIKENKYWTKLELNALFQVESYHGKTILPIWHNLTKKQVLEYSPIVADKKAFSTALMTAQEMAIELKKLFE